MVYLTYYKTHLEAKPPRKAHEFDACYDIYACLKGVDLVKTSFTQHTLSENSPKEVKDVIRVQKSAACGPYIILPALSSTIIPTGIVYGIPAGYRMDVRARSGRAAKYRQFLTNSVGTVDAGYDQELYVLLTNHSGEECRVNHLDKIAQVHLEKVLPIELCEIFNRDQVQQIHSLRGSAGFGSTGDR